MSTCSQTNTPILNQQEDPCNGIHYSTDCLYYPEEIPYLFTGIETSFTEIVQAMVLSLQSNNTRIGQLEEENVTQVNQIETLQVDVDYLQNYTPTLQKVTEAGNTIIVDIDVAKGIDITLSNNSTLYQNGIIVTVPVQTGEYPEYNPAPDAFIAVLNGQNPGTLSGQPVGFLADMTGADNYGFIADLKTGSVASVGSDMRSFDSHTGDLYRGTKFISGVPSQVFKVNNDGDVTAKSFNKTGGSSSEYLMANGSISTMPNLQQVTTAGAVTDKTITINVSDATKGIEINAGGTQKCIVINTPAESPNPYPLEFNNEFQTYFSVDGGGSLVTSGGITANALVVDIQGIIVNSGGVSISGPVSPETNYQLSLSSNSAAKPSTNTWTIASDERVKTNVNPYTKGLETILAINPITYDYNGKAGFDSTNTGNIGVIAQDVLNIIPESINTFHAKLNEEDNVKTELYNFDSHALTFILINAVKQLSAEIELLKAR